MTIRTYVLCLALFITCILGCSKTKPGWKTIDMGEYLIDVPNNFNLKTEKGIDSQPGILKGRDFDLYYDYGLYCDTLVMTQQEYLREGFWKDEAIMRFLDFRLRNNVDWVKTQVVAFRPCAKSDSAFAGGCDLIASCIYKADKFDLPVYIPPDIKNHVVKLDTIQGYYHRVIYPKRGVSGRIGVYMRKAKVDHSPCTLYNSIVIETRSLKNQQQALATEIAATLRPKPKD